MTSNLDAESSLLELTSEIESTGSQAAQELEYQGAVLSQAESHLDKASSEINEATKDLNAIAVPFKRFSWLLSCFNCFCKKRQKVVKIEEEKHLEPKMVEELWCKRYDPNESWLQQVELGLDRLIRMVEGMEKMLSEQEKQSKQMSQKASDIQAKTKKARHTMETMRTKSQTS